MEDHDGRSAAGRTGTDSAIGAGEVDEEGRESFPASDPPGGWAGPDDQPGSTDGGEDPDGEDLGGEAVPEADSAETAAAWERSGAMQGEAPTG